MRRGRGLDAGVGDGGAGGGTTVMLTGGGGSSPVKRAAEDRFGCGAGNGAAPIELLPGDEDGIDSVDGGD